VSPSIRTIYPSGLHTSPTIRLCLRHRDLPARRAPRTTDHDYCLQPCMIQGLIQGMVDFGYPKAAVEPRRRSRSTRSHRADPQRAAMTHTKEVGVRLPIKSRRPPSVNLLVHIIQLDGQAAPAYSRCVASLTLWLRLTRIVSDSRSRTSGLASPYTYCCRGQRAHRHRLCRTQTRTPRHRLNADSRTTSLSREPYSCSPDSDTLPRAPGSALVLVLVLAHRAPRTCALRSNRHPLFFTPLLVGSSSQPAGPRAPTTSTSIPLAW
jgi:hypothetical protein